MAESNRADVMDIGAVKKALSSSSTSLRRSQLQTLEEDILSGEIDARNYRALLPLLFGTYPLYNDRSSRRAVQLCLRAIFRKDESIESIQAFIETLRAESKKLNMAPSNAYVLVEWSAMLLNICEDTPPLQPFIVDIVLSDSRALELCQTFSKRPSIKRSVENITRRALHRLFSVANTPESTLVDLISKMTEPGTNSSPRNAVMLGILSGVFADLGEACKFPPASKVEIYAFYIRELLGSRAVLPAHIASGLHGFFLHFATQEDVDKTLSPALEKALLRNPEIVLNDLVTPLFISLPRDIDLSTALSSKLLKPLLSSTKSSNLAVRQGVLSAFRVMVTRCQDEEAIDGVCDEILTPLRTGKIALPDQRSLYSEILDAFPMSLSLSSKILGAISSLAAKEANEVALNLEVSLLAHRMVWCLTNGVEIETSIYHSFAKGIADKRTPLRKIWATQSGGIIWATENSDLSRTNGIVFLETISGSLLDLWNEVISNPSAAAQSSLISAAFMMIAVNPLVLNVVKGSKVEILWKKNRFSEEALTLEPKPSFLFNHRVYSKLTQETDLSWFIRALQAVSADAIRLEPTDRIASAWAQAFVYCICSHVSYPETIRQASQALSACYVQNSSHVSAIIVNGLWGWIHSVESIERDSAAAAAKTGNSKLYLVVRAICLAPKEVNRLGYDLDQSALERQMVLMLVLSTPGLLPRASWIELCLKVRVDPGELSRKYSEALLSQILAVTNFDESRPSGYSSTVRTAAFKAAAQLVFVAPDMMTGRIVELIQQDLDSIQLENLGPTEIAIFRTPEGTPVVDILAKKLQEQPTSKNIKDYDTLKWEDDLRAQLAKKSGQQKKLTQDEILKVQLQLKKEDVIRVRIKHVEARLLRGTGIIRHMTSGFPTEARLWLNVAVHSLMDVIVAGAGNIIGDSAASSYILCSERVATRVGNMRPFVGIATLRALGALESEEEMTQEPLGALVTRVLYRLRFAGEQRPFDTASLIYILPLVMLVLRNAGYGEKDDTEAQIILSLEFLTFHTDASSDLCVPRDEVISILIHSMQVYKQHYKLIKDCLTDFCRCVGPNITKAETTILLRGAIAPQVSIRTAVLQSINAHIDMTEEEFCDEIWLACHDDFDGNIEIAHEIWEESDFRVLPESVFGMFSYLASKDKQLQRAAARSLAHAVKLQPHTLNDILSKLESSYDSLAKPKKAQLDEYGMPKKTDLSDPWEARYGIALGFKELAPVLTDDALDTLLQFFIDRGPLGDSNSDVRDEMVEAAVAIIILTGKNKVEKLMGMFERTLEVPDEGSDFSDRVNEAVIILYGALAQHLEPGDSRVPAVVERLLATLSTPSETVQFAVAECLPPLVRASTNKTAQYVEETLDKLLKSKKYAARRGAAYGLAGLVHGRGIVALRELRIMVSLKGAIENKKEVNYREGVLFAYELMSSILGRVFEPYVLQIVPQLLSSFGDASSDVRDACLAAAKSCFASLSSFGVKQILPTLLEGLDDQQWRSKKGACDLLGAMAYLDPQQLAQSLPDIIPPLTGVLSDSHKEVRLAANRSLKRFGEVISNPEIKSLVDVLLKALSDPTKHTDDALNALIKISFVHYLDAPSLALVARILERGLGDRSSTKQKSAQVIGSLAHLTERKDLIAHLPILVMGLKVAIVDAVPKTRATASKALGSLVEKLGEDALPDLIPELMQTLKSDTGAGDRLGSAQALSEVLAGLGTSRLEEILPSILQNVVSSKASVREGFMSLFIFLPVCFGNSFASYLSKIIPPILSGLADEVEAIRDTSLRAGRLIVKNFATRSIDLLLPELERGLADDNHRIRLSSVELVGDLLFNLTGINANAEQDEAEEGAQEAGISLLEVLGEDKRNKVLSALYICRCDTSGLVRTAAVAVWKALVASPRTLKELTPTLTQLIIRRLGSSNMEQKVIAGNALGELIRKAGDGVLSTLLPTLEDGLRASTDTDTKQGICIALRELISSATPESLETHEKTLISVVRSALIDSDEEVRDAAAEAFDSLQQIFGKRAVDQVLPYLLTLLRDENEADNALAALLTLLTEITRSNIILPNLIPTLTASPINSFNAKALASLSTVAGPAMTRRLPMILNSLMDDIIISENDEVRADLDASFQTIILSMDEYEGLNTAMSVLLALVKHDDHNRRVAVDQHLAGFFSATTIDYSRYNEDIIRALLMAFNDNDLNVVKAAWSALNEFTKKLKKEEMEDVVIFTRQVLQHIGIAGHDLPGFGLPKGISAILPIFLQGLMNGTSEQRTQSALAISDIVDRTSGDSLKPFVTQLTGPLIRVVSERSTEVKAAVLLTLNNLLEKIPAFLKPFLPQLQRTFAKSLADTSSEILRSRAAKALGTLITLTPRIDPLVTELVTGSKTSDIGVKIAMLKALYEVTSKAGSNMSEASRGLILNLIDIDVSSHDIAVAIINAKLLGALIKNLSQDVASPLLKNRVLSTPFTHASILALNAVLLESPKSLSDSSYAEELPIVICQGIASKNDFVADNCVLAAGKFFLADTIKSFEATKPVFESLATSIQPGNPVDKRRLSLVVVRTVCRLAMDTARPHLSLLAPPIFASVRDPIIPVKLAAEAAFMALFNVVDDESKVFDRYMATQGVDMPANTKRSMQDYFKRVVLKLGNQARERREAEGGQGGLGLSNDEQDDEREIWCIGKVELGDRVFGDTS